MNAVATMEQINIYKMTGSGNDFVIVDNREGVVTSAPDLAREVCARRLSVGADGLILIESSDVADFRMRIINADGSEAEMCGNGSRCVCALAEELGIASGSMSFETLAGIVKGKAEGNKAAVQMTDVAPIRTLTLEGGFGRTDVALLNTGVPHAVLFVGDIEGQDVVGVGREIRYHEAFQPQGTNVDFVGGTSGAEIALRTYERGVEDETLACGTGAVASAIAHARENDVPPPITVRTRSGERLTISFDDSTDGYRNVIMEGPVRKVFQGMYIPK
jgi:diaminopimelate epimerase